MPGASYALSFLDSGNGITALTLYDGLSPYAGDYFTGATANITATSDLRFGILNGEFGTSNWTVGFTANAPEPGTMGAAGLAIAGALAWRRRRKK